MRSGNEVKVGLIFILGVSVFLVFAVYVRGFRAGAETYRVKVIFTDARGLQRGDPVRMVGIKIGQVDFVKISLAREAEVTLKVDADQRIYDNYEFRIGTSGLIQERFVEVVPQTFSPEARALEDGDQVEGVVSPDLSDLVASGRDLLISLNRTSQLLRSVLSDQEVLGAVKDALRNFSDSAAAATKLAQSISQLSAESQPQMAATLEELSSAARELKATTAVVRSRVTETTAIRDLEDTAREAHNAAEKASKLTDSLAKLVEDPQTRKRLSDALSDASQAAADIKEVAADLKVFSAELRKAAPAVPKVAGEAERIAESSLAFRERLRPPRVNASVLYSGEAGRSFSTGSLDFSTSEGQFLRVGIDDIGEESTANIQLGEQQRRGILRYGLVRSRLGLGVDLRLPHEGTLTLDLFDPNALRADILADVPLILGRADLGVTAGVRDLGGDALFVTGVRLRR
jgi:phospholipid/cholesterol/gamma-HCH transport system substrate-binding protein